MADSPQPNPNLDTQQLNPDKPADATPKENLGFGYQDQPLKLEIDPSPMSEVGVSGLGQASGYILEEKLKQLSGAGINSRANMVYREMADNDATVGAILFVLEMIIRKIKWRFEPFSQEPDDVEACQFVESVFEDMDAPLSSVMTEIVSMFTFGWSCLEIVYKRRLGPDQKDLTVKSKYNDGLIGWRRLAGRAQESCQNWVFDIDGDVQGWWQWPPFSGNKVFLPREKILLFRTTNRKNNPQGRSLLRNAYVSYFRKTNMERIEAIGIERDLAGLPLLYVDPAILADDASEDYKKILEEYKRILRNVRNDEQSSLILPSVWNETGTQRLVEFQLVGTGSRRQNDTSGIVSRYSMNIAMTVLADFVLLGHEQVGSFALATQKENKFDISLGAYLDHIADVFNRDGIYRLFELNGFPTDRLPKMIPGEPEKQDLKELSLAIAQITTAGFIKPAGIDDENFWRKKVGMPVRLEVPAQPGEPIDDQNYLSHPDAGPKPTPPEIGIRGPGKETIKPQPARP